MTDKIVHHTSQCSRQTAHCQYDNLEGNRFILSHVSHLHLSSHHKVGAGPGFHSSSGQVLVRSDHPESFYWARPGLDK